MSGNPEFLNMTREDFMILVLGADRDQIMEALNMLMGRVGMAFDADEAAVMLEALQIPEVRMEVANMLATGAEKAGVFG